MRSNLTLISNVTQVPEDREEYQDWTLVPGEIVQRYQPRFLDVGRTFADAVQEYRLQAQRSEETAHRQCSYCHLNGFESRVYGCYTDNHPQCSRRKSPEVQAQARSAEREKRVAMIGIRPDLMDR